MHVCPPEKAFSAFAPESDRFRPPPNRRRLTVRHYTRALGGLPPSRYHHPTMKLPVLSGADKSPWYADGLDFTCTTCGNCCTGGPGYVFVSDEEISRVAAHLNLGVPAFKKQYCRKVLGRVSLKEVRRPNGLHDCVFLTELPAEPLGRDLEPGEPVPLGRRVCGIYPVRPLQCRTWPFWPENLADRSAWDRAAKGCPGMNRGGRHFERERVEELRDTKDWPANPPTSGAAAVVPLGRESARPRETPS
jgi:Fe-S-cluster containining protein